MTSPAQVGAACTSDALLDRFQLRGGPVEAHVATLAHRVEQLEAALRFYADEQRYRGSNRPPIPGDPYSPPELTSYMYDIHRDDGAIARAALANSPKESA